MLARGDIRNWERALETRCNWSWLELAWGGTKISPSDIDFVVERNGRFLFFEVKPTRAEAAGSRGQEILFTRLAALPNVTAGYLVGDIVEHEITPLEICIVGRDWQPIDRGGFLTYCGRWYAWADGRHSGDR